VSYLYGHLKDKMKIIKDKRGLEFKLAFFAVITISAIIISLGAWIDEWNVDYSAGLVYDLDEYDKLSELSTEAEKQSGNISVRTSTQDENFEGTSIRAVFGILNNIYAPFRIVFGNDGMIDSLTDRFGIPDYIRQTIVTMMIIAITFALIAIFFRRNKA